MATVYTWTVEREDSKEPQEIKIEFSKSSEVTVDNIKKKLGADSASILQVFVDSSKDFKTVKSDKELGIIKNGSRLRIASKSKSAEGSRKSSLFKKSSKEEKSAEKTNKEKENPSPKDSKRKDSDKSLKERTSSFLKWNKDEKKAKKERKDSKSKYPTDKTELSNNGMDTTNDVISNGTVKTEADTKDQSRHETPQESPKMEQMANVHMNGKEIEEHMDVTDDGEQWKMTLQMQEEYQKQFRNFDDDEDGFVTMDQVPTLFGEYGLGQDVLKNIWFLADAQQLERLDVLGFMLVKYIVQAVAKGAQVPSEVPQSLRDSATARKPRQRSLMREDDWAASAMRGSSRGRSNAFYTGGVQPMPVDPSYSSSALVRPTKKPKISPEGKVRAESSRFKVGYADTIGRRPTMEDELVIFGNFRGKEDEDFFGIFDGHGGRAASSFAAEKLQDVFTEKLQSCDNDPIKSLSESFIEIHAVMKKYRIKGGSTAVVSYFIGNTAYIANAGDSRAVLGRDGEAKRVTKDHKPDVPEEAKRIKDLGGTISTTVDSLSGKVISRVCQQLSVARSLGDFTLEPYVTPVPEVFTITVSQDAKNHFLIMACDGLWDVMTDQEAVDIVSPIDDPEQAAVKLRDVALEKGTDDNVTVLIIRFPPFEGDVLME